MRTRGADRGMLNAETIMTSHLSNITLLIANNLGRLPQCFPHYNSIGTTSF